MGTRSNLQLTLETLLGSQSVYFQPPASLRMEYPAIVYKRDTAASLFAGNKPYRYVKRYQVTVISKDPDSNIPEKVAALPMCIHARFFTVNNLNHDVYTLYY